MNSWSNVAVTCGTSFSDLGFRLIIHKTKELSTETLKMPLFPKFLLFGFLVTELKGPHKIKKDFAKIFLFVF